MQVNKNDTRQVLNDNRLSKLAPDLLQKEFEDDFCRVLIAINTAWVAADNHVLRAFMGKWVSHPVTVPNRRIVSGRVLERVAEGVETSVAVTVAGKMGTGQSDGWKNVAKTHLVSSLMSVENEVRHLFC